MSSLETEPATSAASRSIPVPSPAALWRRADRVILAMLGILGALALWRPEQAGASLAFMANSLTGILPFLLLSVAFAAGAQATGADKLIARAFSGHPVRMIATAALFGVISPFCSCGVIPIIAGFLGAGVPLAPVMAFWLASPLMDPQKFVLMVAQLGLGYTVATTLAALGIGLFGGFATLMLERSGRFSAPLKQMPGCGCRYKPEASAPVWAFWRDGDRRRLFGTAALDNGWFLIRWLSLAFLIESLMVAYVPAGWVVQWLGSNGALAIPAAVAVGVPAYLNGFAAIPLIAGLVEMGMNPAAALAFMIAGGVTSIPAALGVFVLVKRGVFLWYLGLAIAGSILAAYTYQMVLAVL